MRRVERRVMLYGAQRAARQSTGVACLPLVAAMPLMRPPSPSFAFAAFYAAVFRVFFFFHAACRAPSPPAPYKPCFLRADRCAFAWRMLSLRKRAQPRCQATCYAARCWRRAAYARWRGCSLPAFCFIFKFFYAIMRIWREVER